jgi:hypothetical protein
MEQHPFFKFGPAGGAEAAYFAIATDYAVAGDNQGQRIFGKCATYGPGSSGPAYLFR